MPIIPSQMELEKRKNEGKKDERPDFGKNQIKSPKELKPGLIVLKMPGGIVIKVLTKPYKGWVHVKFPDREPESMSLAEVSIVPYPSGMWNTKNWLSRS